MIFFYNLERHEAVILILLIILLAGVFYYFAVKSRKTYTCPECGEQTKVEHMDTARCGMCGSLLEKDDKE